MSVLNKNPILKKSRINERHGADIASASTINLTMATGNLVDVTGTTAITAITMPDGAERVVRFTGALTLTHGASLILPGSANITTAAGDFATFRGYASGVVRCVSYNRLSGHPVLPVGMNLLSTVTAATSSTVDLETTLDSTYDAYVVVATDVTVSTDGADVLMRVKSGGAYDAGANYSYHIDNSNVSAGTYAGQASSGDASIPVGESLGNGTGESLSFTLNIYGPSGTALHKIFDWSGGSLSTAGALRKNSGTAKYSNTAAITGIRFLPTSGTILTGNFRLYGIKK